ncbi:MAG TPA: tetratricopeptide repeat protein, partial [Bauldia sp.]|nr:tetratricopeptide repeat protein [Bauldia sp.]
RRIDYGMGRFGAPFSFSGVTADVDQEKAKALFFEGLALFDEADFAGAEAKLRGALAIVPDRPSALTNLAAVLVQQERLDEATALAGRAAEIDPNSPENWITLSAAQGMLHEATAALASAERAVTIAPRNPLALMARAAALSELRRHDLAVADYLAARRINPHEKGLLAVLVSAKMQNCQWEGLDADVAELLRGVRQGSERVKPFTLLSVPGATLADQARVAAETVAREAPPRPAVWHRPASPRGRIRLAYVSGDFRDHPLSHLMAGIFERHDRARFEVLGVSYGVDDGSDIRRRILSAFDKVLDARNQSDDAVAALIAESEADIAVDLGGHTSGGRPRIFVRRPAPVQVAYLGYPATSAIPAIDYLFADRIVVPQAEWPHYSEKIVWLPHSYYPHDDRQPIVDTPMTRADHGLPAEGFVFCSFNNSYKIAPAVFDVWMAVLRQTPESVLWLLDSTAGVSANLRREATVRGVAPERLIFAPRMRTAEHLARHRLADLFLDTLPYNAHTTAADALWAGLPLITCPGETFPSRVAASLLTAVGMPELIASSLDEYAALAVRLARDPAALAAVKAKLAANRDGTPLFDTARFTRYLEAAYATMVERHRRGEAPAAFAVAE